MKRKRKKIILGLMFLSGVFIMLYPFFSNYWNSLVQSQAITDYDKSLVEVDDNDYQNVFEAAESYNTELSNLTFPFIQYKKLSGYASLLNWNQDGMIGYLSIDKIKVQLPIYHGTSSSILNVAVGHLEGSSLPIGGTSTHSVLSAHRGLPSSKLFTNLNKLEVGDIFVITVLNRKLTYQVDKIVIVEPNDISGLEIADGEDYVTLMTCTPYGINTHRLLVRGTRIQNEKLKEVVVTSDAYQVDKMVVALWMALPILLICMIYVMIRPVKKRGFKGVKI